MKKITLVFSFLLLAVAMFAVEATVYDIQYTTAASGDSPLVDQEVTVTGIVSADHYKGEESTKFFLCDLPEVGTGAWHGVYVYYFTTDPDGNPLPGLPEVAVGDQVTLTATVTEYYNLTEITDVTALTIDSSNNEVPAPAVLASNDVNNEMYEGCLVTVQNITVVNEQDQYGVWSASDGSGQAFFDDGFFYLDSVDPVIEITQFEQWGSITGIVEFSYDYYKINPRTVNDMVQEVSTENVEVAPVVLTGNYPNPFNPETAINFSVNEDSNVSIEIYNILGQKVKALVNDTFPKGQQTVKWNGNDDNNNPVSSGVYFYRMKSGKYTSTKKMILLK